MPLPPPPVASSRWAGRRGLLVGLSIVGSLVGVLFLWMLQRTSGGDPTQALPSPQVSAAPGAGSSAGSSPGAQFGSFNGPVLTSVACCWQRWTMDTGAVSVDAPAPATYWTHPNEWGAGFKGSSSNMAVQEDIASGSPQSIVAGTAHAIRSDSKLAWSNPTPLRRNGSDGLELHTIAVADPNRIDYTMWLFASKNRLYTIQVQFRVGDETGKTEARAFLDSVRMDRPQTAGAA
jgi:hypothetical protein